MKKIFLALVVLSMLGCDSGPRLVGKFSEAQVCRKVCSELEQALVNKYDPEAEVLKQDCHADVMRQGAIRVIGSFVADGEQQPFQILAGHVTDEQSGKESIVVNHIQLPRAGTHFTHWVDFKG